MGLLEEECRALEPKALTHGLEDYYIPKERKLGLVVGVCGEVVCGFFHILVALQEKNVERHSLGFAIKVLKNERTI